MDLSEFFAENKEMFQQKIPLDFTVGHYRVRTIKTATELAEILKYRQELFPGLILRALHFDMEADHLIVEDLETQEVCGAYRISSSTFVKEFQTQEDFQISSFLKAPGVKVELAWAWVKEDYRNGTVISHLWHGVSEYLKQVKAHYVFGTTSVINFPLERIVLIQEILKRQGLLFHKFSIEPLQDKKSAELLHFNVQPKINSSRKISRMLPTLLRAYLAVGALVCVQPAFDSDLNCYDFMTVWEVAKDLPAR